MICDNNDPINTGNIEYKYSSSTYLTSIKIPQYSSTVYAEGNSWINLRINGKYIFAQYISNIESIWTSGTLINCTDTEYDSHPSGGWACPR